MHATPTDVTYRLYRGSREKGEESGDTTYVIYKIRLSDGRMIRLDIPFNADLTDSQALTGSRVLAERKIFVILAQEFKTGKYHCCHGTIPQHADQCEAG